MKLSSVENLNDEQLLEIYEDVLDYNTPIFLVEKDTTVNTTCYGLCNCSNGTRGYGNWTWSWWQGDFYSGSYAYTFGFWDLCDSSSYNSPCRNIGSTYVYLYDCRKVKK